NNDNLVEKILSSAKEADEYMWQLPIIEPFRKDMKSNIADLKNMGGSRFGGTSKAAAFLENFVDPKIPWAHLDIAGVGDSQSHLPYCPTKGASGSIVRTLTNYLLNQ
ncbi:MAG: aminopeptidase, partial [Bdellovibrionota bacterium]|nr:aminopeptidase [Bdellovibrionota bacterium]